jgi:transposase
LAHPDGLDAEEERFLERMTGCSPETAKAYQLAQRFREMAREGKLPKTSVGGWRMLCKAACRTSRVLPRGLGEREAVKAALKEPWSNGQVEGHISRSKFPKRQMYDRADFDLLRR